MLEDKSLSFYGPLYRRLFDPQLAEVRQVTVDLSGGGIDGLLKESALSVEVAHRSIFWRRYREVVVLRRR